MIYILDTDLFTICQLTDSPEYRQIHRRTLELAPNDQIVTTIITYEEQTRGWLAYAAKSREIQHQVKAYNRLKKHLLMYLRIEVLEFDAPAAKEFDQLLRLKLRIGTADIKIAAIALSMNAVLLSRNIRDFQKIPGLKVEDWVKG